MAEQVIEWAPFVMKEGVTAAMVTSTAKQVQDEFICRQPGFVRRVLAREDDGTYVDVIWWASMAEAEAAMEKAAASAVCGRYFDLMQLDPADPANVKHLHVVEEY